MKYLELREKIKRNIFNHVDVLKLFPQENPQMTKIQLYRFVKKGLLTKIKRGLYCFKPENVDEFELANWLYQPSYISLESALNYYGIIPDIPQGVTSVCVTTTKKVSNQFGSFYYLKIKSSLFYGFFKVKSATGFSFNLAKKEKALLDYLYLRKIRSTYGLRLNIKELDRLCYQKYSKDFPSWIQKVKL